MRAARGRLWSVANGLMLVMFVFSAVVQVNDPDPVSWIAIYTAAAMVCALVLVERQRWWVAAIVGAVALVWAATLSPRVLGIVPFTSMFEEFEMKDIHIEESREMYGLLIVAAWMLVVALVLWQRSRRAERLFQ
jgi:hypothetical protein